MATLIAVTFRFPARLAPAARRVSVVGTFNSWNPDVHQMRRSDDGWTITIYLPAGRVVYAFSAGGAIWLDPEDEGRMPNGWGSEYSVRYVGTKPVAAGA